MLGCWMHPVIHCRSARFDLSSEPSNPINPIPGHSLLVWLAEQLAATIQLSEPSPEDWGWYCTGKLGDVSYLVGACAHPSVDGRHEWVVQVDRDRSLFDRLLRRSRVAVDDACFAAIKTLLEHDESFSELTVEFGP